MVFGSFSLWQLAVFYYGVWQFFIVEVGGFSYTDVFVLLTSEMQSILYQKYTEIPIHFVAF